MILATPEQERELIALLPGADCSAWFLAGIRRWVNGPIVIELKPLLDALRIKQ